MDVASWYYEESVKCIYFQPMYAVIGYGEVSPFQ